MNTIYFHIGLPKTGSTYLQKILDSDARINLSRSNIHKFHKEDNFDFLSHKINVDSNETYLLRGEGAKKFNMMLCLSKIRNIHKNIQIIVTLRKPLPALSSMFKYRIRNGGYFKSFDDWFINDEAQDFFSVLHYGTLHKSLNTFFKNSEINYVFYEDLKDNVMIDEFYDILNLKPPEIKLKQKVNQSLSQDELLKINTINKYISHKKIRKLVVKTLPSFSFKKKDDFFESKLTNKISSKIKEEMEWFYEICDENTKAKLKAHNYLN